MPAPPLQKKISQAFSAMSPPKPYGMPSGIFKLASQTTILASRGCWWICQHRWPMGRREPAQQANYWDMHVFCIHQSTQDCGAPPTEAARGAKLPTIFGAHKLAMTWMTAPEPVLMAPTSHLARTIFHPRVVAVTGMGILYRPFGVRIHRRRGYLF